MNRKSVHSGISLIELMIVIGTMVILMAIAVPAVKGIIASFDNSAGARPLINAALSAARSIAIREQTYAGVRFQEDADGNTYMIFIVHDLQRTGLANGFCAVTGRNPMKLPDDTGVLQTFEAGQTDAEKDTLMSTASGLTGQSTFSIVFSPAGRMVVHPVRIRNMNGYHDGYASISDDTIFNIAVRVEAGRAMFYQDDYPALGLEEEYSRREFLIYDKKAFKLIFPTQRYSNFFKKVRTEHISSYTGEIVTEYRENKQ